MRKDSSGGFWLFHVNNSKEWVWLHRYFRFATVKYDHTGKNLWNPCMHLCNYSINKYHSGFSTSTYFLAVFVHTNYEILIIQKRRFWPFFSQTTSRAVILTSMTRSLSQGNCSKEIFHTKTLTNDLNVVSYQGHKWSLSAFLKHLKANNIDTVQLMQSIEDVIIKVFVIIKKIFCKYPVDHQDLINIQSFFYFVNILSITCRRSSALSFRWTRPARCLSHIGTYQLLQCCIMYFAFCILYFWNTNIKHHIGTYINPVGWRNHFQMPFSNFCWSGIIVLSSTDLIFW